MGCNSSSEPGVVITPSEAVPAQNEKVLRKAESSAVVVDDGAEGEKEQFFSRGDEDEVPEEVPYQANPDVQVQVPDVVLPSIMDRLEQLRLLPADTTGLLPEETATHKAQSDATEELYPALRDASNVEEVATHNEDFALLVGSNAVFDGSAAQSGAGAAQQDAAAVDGYVNWLARDGRHDLTPHPKADGSVQVGPLLLSQDLAFLSEDAEPAAAS